MTISHLATTVAAIAVLGSLATAQFTRVNPFSGTAGTEGFETQDTSGGSFPPCIEDRVFADRADLCSNSAHLTSVWGHSCSIDSHGGTRLFGSADGAATYTFDDYATRFGGYFGNNSGTDHGVINFYDEYGALLYSDRIIAPADCTWAWNGWDSGGALIKSVEVVGNVGGAMMMNDDLEADIVDGETGRAYCF